jgi:hypothetical protein
MKKITVTISAWVIPWLSNAQPLSEVFVDSNMLKIGIAVICMGLAMLFVLEMFRRFFEYQIKSKALELRVPEELATVILKDKPENDRKSQYQMVFIFAGLGIGLSSSLYTSLGHAFICDYRIQPCRGISRLFLLHPFFGKII